MDEFEFVGNIDLKDNLIKTMAMHPSGTRIALASSEPTKIILITPNFNSQSNLSNPGSIELLIDYGKFLKAGKCKNCFNNPKSKQRRSLIKKGPDKMSNLKSPTETTNGVVTIPKTECTSAIRRNEEIKQQPHVSSLAWSPCGNLLAVGFDNGAIGIMKYDIQNHNLEPRKLILPDVLKNIPSTNQTLPLTVKDALFLQDSYCQQSSLLIASGGDGNHSIRVIDVQSLAIIQKLYGHTGSINRMHSAGGCTFVTCSNDKTFRCWDLRSGNYTMVIDSEKIVKNNPKTTPTDNVTIETSIRSQGSNKPTSVFLHDAEHMVYGGHQNGSVLLYDIRAVKTLKILRNHTSAVTDIMMLTGNYPYALTSSLDATIRSTNTKDISKIGTTPIFNYTQVGNEVNGLTQSNWRKSFLKSGPNYTSGCRKHSDPCSTLTSPTTTTISSLHSNHSSSTKGSDLVSPKYPISTQAADYSFSKIIVTQRERSGIVRCAINPSTAFEYSNNSVLLTCLTKDNGISIYQGTLHKL